MSWRSRSSGPPRSWRRPGPGWPGRPRKAQPGWSACTIPMPARSAKGASTGRSSSARKPRSPTTTTASSWITASNTAPPQTGHSWHPQWNAFTGVLAACRVPLPPTAATARPPSSTTCRHWACTPSRFPARPRSHPAAGPPSTARASANSSSGAPVPKAGSAISSTPTGGTAPTWTVKKCRYLVRTRGLHPQPGQDRRPGQLTTPRGQPLHHLSRARPAPASRQGLFQVEVAS